MIKYKKITDNVGDIIYITSNGYIIHEKKLRSEIVYHITSFDNDFVPVLCLRSLATAKKWIKNNSK